MIQSVGVYCGSADSAAQPFKKAAAALGKALADAGIQVVYGGGQMGLMGILANAVLKEGGRVIGFMPRFLHHQEGGDFAITDLHFVDTMHERKQRMFEASDAFIILPGGLGTLDEAFEMLTWKQIGLHQKHLIILNIDGYWTPLFDQFLEKMIQAGFLAPVGRTLFTMVSSVTDAMILLQTKSSHPHQLVTELS